MNKNAKNKQPSITQSATHVQQPKKGPLNGTPGQQLPISTPGPTGENEGPYSPAYPIRNAPLDAVYHDIFQPRREDGRMFEGVLVYNATESQARTIAQAHHLGTVMMKWAIDRLYHAKKKPDPLVEHYFRVKSIGGDDTLSAVDKEYSFESLPVDKSDKWIDQLPDEYVLNLLLHTFLQMHKEFAGTGYWVHQDEIEYILNIGGKVGESFCHYVLTKSPFVASTAQIARERHKAISIVWPLFYTKNTHSRAKTLVHEEAHYCNPGVVIDEAYAPDDKFSKLTQVQCLHNADSYAQFARSCYEAGTMSQKLK